MERGVLWGGLLISGSFLLAVTLHQAAREPPGAGIEGEHIEATPETFDDACAKVVRDGSSVRVRRSSDCDRAAEPGESLESR